MVTIQRSLFTMVTIQTDLIVTIDYTFWCNKGEHVEYKMNRPFLILTICYGLNLILCSIGHFCLFMEYMKKQNLYSI